VVETVFDSTAQYGIVCCVLVVAEAVYVLLGFGAGLIAVGTLALVMPELRDVVVVLLLVNLPAELFVVWRSRRLVAWRGVLVVFVGVAVGIPVGTWMLGVGRPGALLTGLGIVLVAAGAAFLVTDRPGERPMPVWIAPPLGLASGILTGLFGTGGPPLILYYRLAGVSKAVFRGSLMAIFLLMTAVRVPSYVAFGLVTGPRIWSSIAVFPAVLVGAWIGQRTHVRISEPAFRRLVAVSLIAIGAILLARRFV
jgi:uncharacterized membrane protein YfcA